MFNIYLDNKKITTVSSADEIAPAVGTCAHDFIRANGAQEFQYLHNIIDRFIARGDYRYVEDVLHDVFGVTVAIEYETD